MIINRDKIQKNVFVWKGDYMDKVKQLLKELGIRYNKLDLYVLALTHSSFNTC